MKFERVEQFKRLRTTLTNQDFIHEEFKSRFKPGNAYYHSVQNPVSSSLLSKNVKIKIHKIVMLSVFCTGVKFGLSHWGRNTG